MEGTAESTVQSHWPSLRWLLVFSAGINGRRHIDLLQIKLCLTWLCILQKWSTIGMVRSALGPVQRFFWHPSAYKTTSLSLRHLLCGWSLNERLQHRKKSFSPSLILQWAEELTYQLGKLGIGKCHKSIAKAKPIESHLFFLFGKLVSWLCESTVNREGPCWKRRRREKAIQERRLLNLKIQKDHDDLNK